MKRIFRWSSKASVIGGILFGLNIASIRLTNYTRIESEMHALGLVAGLPLLVALIGLHQQYGRRYGMLGYTAFFVSVVSLVTYALGNFAIALFAALLDIDAIANNANVLWVLSIHALGGGGVLLGIALARARILPLTDTLPLIIGGTLLAISPLIPATAFLSYSLPDVKSFLVVLALVAPFSLAWVRLGYMLRTETPTLQA